MKNLLIGNGLLIQYGGKDYTNKSIVSRTLENYERKDFPSHIIAEPMLAKTLFGHMMRIVSQILNGEFDSYVVCSDEMAALRTFIERYINKSSLQISDIGFEDFYLIFDLMCHKNKMQNPDQFQVREMMKAAFLHSIYNNGSIDKVYCNFPVKLVEFIKSFDNIFTTNYDNNIEQATEREIYHIHGSFYERNDIYNPNSLRNQLRDCPIKEYVIDEDYFYIYSTAISAHCGDYKNMYIAEAEIANSVIEQYADRYCNDNNFKEEVDTWENSDNPLVARLFDAIKVKIVNPDIKFTEAYHANKLVLAEGELYIVGLSPYNDFHIFDMINKSNLYSVSYYYFDKSECELIKDLIPLKKIKFFSVVDLWKELE